MIQIFESMEANNVQLVNNFEFLNWAQVTRNPGASSRLRPIESEELPASVRNAFLT